MHLCFVDESGTPAKLGQAKPEFFVMAAVVVPEERWHNLADKLNGLKVREHYRGELKWRFFAPNNTDDANPMREWDQDRRNKFRLNVFNILTAEKSIKIISAVCQARPAYRLPNVNEQSDIYFRTYKVVTERFQYLLQDITKTSGRWTAGIIVADHRGKGDDERLRKQHQRLVFTESNYTSTYNNLVEGLFFAPSHMSIGIQFADMVAGAIWRRFEANDETWFKAIESNLRRSASGKIDGFGIARFPKQDWNGPIVE